MLKQNLLQILLLARTVLRVIAVWKSPGPRCFCLVQRMYASSQPPPRLTAWHPFAQYGIILFCFASVVYEGISGRLRQHLHHTAIDNSNENKLQLQSWVKEEAWEKPAAKRPLLGSISNCLSAAHHRPYTRLFILSASLLFWYGNDDLLALNPNRTSSFTTIINSLQWTEDDQPSNHFSHWTHILCIRSGQTY